MIGKAEVIQPLVARDVPVSCQKLTSQLRLYAKWTAESTTAARGSSCTYYALTASTIGRKTRRGAF